MKPIMRKYSISVVRSAWYVVGSCSVVPLESRNNRAPKIGLNLGVEHLKNELVTTF